MRTKVSAPSTTRRRKPWRQKGTGNARQGSIRAPQWIKGAYSDVVRVPVPAVEVLGPTAEIERVTYRNNVELQGGLGMKFFVSFKVRNFKGTCGRVILYFSDEDGKDLVDTDHRYGTTGEVSNVAAYEDFELNSGNEDVSALANLGPPSLCEGPHG